jgi:G3E family GTPase
MYMKNFGEFFNDQISNAGCIVLSHTQSATDEKIEESVKLLREKNPTAIIVTTPWDSLDGKQLLAAMERRDTIEEELARLAASVHDEDECDDPDCCCHHHHHDHDHDHDEEAHGHHHHHHDEDECDDPECECHHHHHDHDHDEDGHEHHHHHHHHDKDECDDPDCCCHHHHDEEHEHGHHHGHHHHHHADEVFVSYGAETTKKFGKEELTAILDALNDEKYGFVLRAKGIVECKCGAWLHFDYVPGESNVRKGSAAITGRLCVIGSKLDRDALAALFGVELK